MLAAAILAATAAQAQVGSQFDLDCNGLMTSDFDGRKSESKYHVRMHIDLNNREWCVDDCSSLMAIAQINDNAIILSNYKEEHLSAYFQVNRRSGELVEVSEIRGGNGKAGDISVWGRCTPALFTPFPERKF